jgi:GMP synthase-like glutamine amidotransferase
MKPIAIVQHEADVGPGNFELHLQQRGVPYQIVRIDAGDRMPASAEPYAGLCSLGGNMSVNDALPWIDQELALLRDADARGVPVIGHCLGGQLLAKALGAQVTRAPYLEMGWAPVELDDAALAREWLGSEAGDIEYFQWHGDMFELPAGAHRILTSRWCANQAYIVPRTGFAHVGMQFHIEMTPELVRNWTADPHAASEIDAERQRTGGPAVQSTDEMREGLDERTARMDRVAAHLYDRWLRGKRG